MNKYFFVSALLFAALLTTVACDKSSGNSYTDNVDCSAIDAASNTYTLAIKAILDAKCATSGCHDAITQEHSIDYSTLSGAKNGFTNHDGLCSIYQDSGCDPMPEGGAKLDDLTIQKITCWVKNGYPE